MFYKLSAAGGVVSRTAFISGSDGEIASIVLNGPAHIIAGGYIRGDDGRKNGWLMGLNPDLSIAWQRQYPRGGAAQFNHVTTYGDSYLIATGESAPGGGGSPQAGWVMMARSDSGEIYWQRYYTGKLNYAARSSLIAKDGLISTLIDAWAPDKSEEQPAVRLLSINPRGVVQINDEYIFAAGVRANYMTLGAEGVRVILGSTNTSRKLEAANEKAGPATPGSEDQGLMRRSADAWIMAATVTNPYHDPCTVPKAAMP